MSSAVYATSGPRKFARGQPHQRKPTNRYDLQLSIEIYLAADRKGKEIVSMQGRSVARPVSEHSLSLPRALFLNVPYYIHLYDSPP